MNEPQNEKANKSPGTNTSALWDFGVGLTGWFLFSNITVWAIALLSTLLHRQIERIFSLDYDNIAITAIAVNLSLVVIWLTTILMINRMAQKKRFWMVVGIQSAVIIHFGLTLYYINQAPILFNILDNVRIFGLAFIPYPTVLLIITLYAMG